MSSGASPDDDAGSSLEEHGASIRSWWLDGEAQETCQFRVGGAVAGSRLSASHQDRASWTP